MSGENKLGFLDVLAITAMIAAFIGDVAFIFALGALIPVVGLTILAVILLAHYMAGLMVAALVIPKLNGLIPKLIIVAGIILPLPTLLLSIILAIIFQSEILQTVAKQAAVVAIGTATAGTGAVAAEGAIAAEGAAAAAGGAATGAAEGAAAGAKGVGAAKTAAGAGRGSVTAEEETAESEVAEKSGAERAGKEISPEEFGEEPEPMEKLQKRLFEEAQSDGTNKEDEEGIYEDGNEIDLRKAVNDENINLKKAA